MLELSPAMQAYEKSLLDESSPRDCDSKEQPVPAALTRLSMLRSPLQAILPTGWKPCSGSKGLRIRIRELEAQMSREEIALRIGDDFVARKFGENITSRSLTTPSGSRWLSSLKVSWLHRPKGLPR